MNKEMYTLQTDTFSMVMESYAFKDFYKGVPAFDRQTFYLACKIADNGNLYFGFDVGHGAKKEMENFKKIYSKSFDYTAIKWDDDCGRKVKELETRILALKLAAEWQR